MSQTRNYNQRGSGSRRTSSSVRGNRNIYVYDNTARRLEVQRQIAEPARKPVQHEVRKNRDKARHMSMGYVLFLAAALVVAGLILVNYVQMQAELTNMTRVIATKESELSNLQMTNDEAYNRVMSSIDLEEVKRIAIGELGMVYAQDGQVYTYTNESNDYMRQVIQDAN